MPAMRIPLLVTTVLALAVPTASQPTHVADDTAMRRVIADNTTAYNRRDAKALVAHLAPDADHIGVTGDWVSGKDALERSLVDYFAAGGRPTTEDAVQRIRFLAPDVAVAIVKRVYKRDTGDRTSVAT
jgi:uncharacterized protein (TIGR02246 family)